MLTIWGFARAYLRPHRLKALLLGALVLGGTAVQLAGPLILRRFVNDAVARQPLAGMVALAAAYCLLTAMQQVVSIADAHLATDLAFRATNRVRLELFERCLRLDLSFHHNTPPGALIQRIEQDPALLNEVFSRTAVTLISNGLIVLGVICLVFLVDWRVGMVLLAFAALGGLIRLGTASAITRAWRSVRECAADLYGCVEEVLGAAEDLLASGAEAYAQRRVQEGNRQLVGSTLRAILTDGVGGASITVFKLGTTAALGVAVALREAGHLTIGDVFMVTAYGQLCLNPLQQVARQIQDLQPARAVSCRIQEVLAMQPSIRWEENGHRLPGGALSVEVRDVRFGYGDADAVLEGIDLQLAPGSVLGLLGRTASGKSTLARLLVRLYDPERGSVRVGGIDLRAVSREDLRRRVAFVAQDVQVVEGSLRDNLTLFAGHPGGQEDDELIRALARVGLRDWLASAPAGLETRLGPGLTLSAGEQQLISLARVLLLSPGLVVLDEPSARLDPATQARLDTSLRDLFRHCTAVVIAHRLETLESATHIMVLQDGRVAEFGERGRLLRDPNSRYAELRRRAGMGVPE